MPCKMTPLVIFSLISPPCIKNKEKPEASSLKYPIKHPMETKTEGIINDSLPYLEAAFSDRSLPFIDNHLCQEKTFKAFSL